MRERLHGVAIVGFAAALGLNEAAAQVGCVLALLTTAATGRLRRPVDRLERLVLIWALAGLPALALHPLPRSSGAVTLPLMALAVLVGGRGLSGVPARVLGRAAVAFSAALVLNAAWGVAQARWGALPLDALLLKNPVSPQTRVPGHWNTRLASGLYYNRLKLAHMGIYALGLLGVLGLGPVEGRRPRDRGLVAVAALVVLAGVVLAYARAALVAWIGAGAVLAAVAAGGRAGPRVLALGAAAGLGVLASPFGRERLAAASGDLEGRRRMLELGLRMFLEHPLLGVGHGGYRATAVTMIEGHWAPVRLTSSHNLWLHAFDETGLIGGLAFAVALGLAARRLLQRVRAERGRGDARSVAHRAAAFVLLATFLLGLVHQPIHHVPTAFAVWLAVGLATEAHGSEPRR